MGQYLQIEYLNAFYLLSSLKLPPPFLKFGIMALNNVIRKLTIEFSFSVGVNRATRSTNPRMPITKAPQLSEKKLPASTGSATVASRVGELVEPTPPSSWVNATGAVL